MILWGEDWNPNVRRIKAAANYAGLEITVKEYNPIKATEAQTREYSKLNPTGSLPTLITPEGSLYQTNSILRYIARNSKTKKLYGGSLFDNAQVDQWLDWEFIELEPAALTFTLPYLGLFPYLKDVHSKAEEDLSKALEFLDKCLKGKKFIVGNETTIADISIASSLNVCFQWIFDEKYREKIPNVVNWYENVINEEYWRKEYGKPILCKLPLKFPG